MPPEIVVLGAGGMLGHKMLQRLHSAFPGAIGIMRGNAPAPWQEGRIVTGVDVRAFEKLAALLREIRPAWIINCAGVIKQRPEAAGEIECITVNALLPHRLAALAAEWGGRLIHFSTDCVFSGSQGNYREDDFADAADLYGRTKFLGEVHAANALTLRTSIIGREITGGRSLLEWFLARNGGVVPGFRRAIWSGVTTNHAALLVADILQHHPDLSGLYHLASRPLSKYDLLCRLREAYALAIEIVPDEAEECDRSLCGEKLHAAIGYTAPSWTQMLHELAADPTPYQSRRTQ